MARSKRAAYRVRFVVYDVMDVVVEASPALAHERIVEMAVAQAAREQPLIAWEVEWETATVELPP